MLVGVLDAARANPGPSGFQVGFGSEIPVKDGDLTMGMSYLRLTGFGAPITMFNLADMRVSPQSTVAWVFGATFSVATAQGIARPGIRLFLGIELFHRKALPVSLTAELLLKMCENDKNTHQCPENEQQTWVAGGLGFKL